VRGDALSATLWVVAQGAGERAPGLLTELRAHLVRAQAPVAAGVTGFRLADDGETILLMAENSVTELRRRDLDTVRLYRLSFDPRYVILDGSHRRAFVGAQHGSDIAILDRDKGTVVASMKTGRGSVKFGKGLLSALSMAGPVIYWPGGTATAAVLTPDAGRLFVVNVQTNDVTAIDTDGAKALDTLRVGTRPYEVNLTRGADALWIFSSEHATRLNPRTLAQADVDLTRTEGFTGWPLYDQARERILLPRETGIEVLSAHDGSRSGMVDGLKHPVTVRSVVRLGVALADPAPAE
jgi:YVTN family beta-propeller protein